jgi:hypothetical protein
MKRFLSALVLVLAFWGGEVFCSSRLTFSSRTSAINLKRGSRFTISNPISGFNGTLLKGKNATITGGNIIFDFGTYEDDGNRIFLDGTFNPDSGQILLNGGARLQGSPGRVFTDILISGTDNRLEGQPILTKPFSFDANATLTMAIDSRLDQNIQFDSSGTNTILLDGDLFLADDVTITNSGTIDVNGKSFWFGGKDLTLSNTIFWLNAGDVNLSSKIVFNGVWEINSETTVNGHGNVIDLSGGGVFSLAASTTVHFTDVTILGIRSSTFVFGDAGSTVRLSNVTLRFDESVTMNLGLFYIDGSSTIYLPNFDWTFNSPAKITVDGVTVWVDGLGVTPTGKVLGNYSLVNNGTIKGNQSWISISDLDLIHSNSEAIILVSDLSIDNSYAIISGGGSELSISNSEAIVLLDALSSSNSEAILLIDDLSSSNSEAIILVNDLSIANSYAIISGGGSELSLSNSEAIVILDDRLNNIDSTIGDIIIDTSSGPLLYDIFLSPNHRLSFTEDLTFTGSTHFVHFSKTDEAILLLDANVSVTTKDLVIRNFSEDRISLGSGSSLIWGDKTRIEICSNENLNLTWTCSGDITFDGDEKQLSLESGSLYVMAGSRLFFENITLSGVKDENIKCEDDTASIIFRNSDLLCTNTVAFNNGSILFEQDVTLRGTVPFAYASRFGSTISSQATLCFESGFTWSYDPPVGSKDLLIFEDHTATLAMKGGTLHTTSTGITLKTGQLKIDKNSFMTAEGDGEITFGNEVGSQDLTCVFAEQTKLTLQQGSLGYKNILSGSWSMLDELSILRISAGSRLRLYQTLDPGEGLTDFGAGAYLFVASGKTLGGTIGADADINYGTLP